ncbi:MAG: hypothetical protein ILP14_06570 [Oscillospiraceae bacterium]|nr:hypothetical protein [Oscillospiraceae bacterium]
MFCTDIYEPRVSDYNQTGRLSFEAMLQIIENTANHHMIAAHDKLVNGDIAWVLADWRVVIKECPTEGQKLHVRTWTRAKARAAAIPRDFLVTGDDGREFFRANARFALLDMKTKRLVRITEELLEAYGPESEQIFDDEAPRLKAPEEFDFVGPLVLRRSDMDYNGHVHNTRYITFAEEALPAEEYRENDFSSFRIVCASSVEAGSHPEIRRTALANGWLFTIYADGHVCTLIQLLK